MGQLAVLLVALWCSGLTIALPFRDVSRLTGLNYSPGPRKKYGGPSIADLDGDGRPDLMLGHHGGYSEVYYNEGGFKFRKTSFRLYRDTHAINAFRLSTFHPRLHFSVSRGASNGQLPQPPDVFRVEEDRSITNVTVETGLVDAQGRGRSMLYLQLTLENGGVGPDALVLNAKPFEGRGRHHLVYKTVQNGSNTMFVEQRLSGGFEMIGNQFATVTDIDGDMRMEVISWHDLKIHQLQADYVLRDISSLVFPWDGERRAVTAVAELDFDNDGDFDLYIGRGTRGGGVRWLDGKEMNFDDMLLRNDNGRFVDVSEDMGIGKGGHTRGVTVGDFDNDGWMDVMVTRFDSEDLLLLNRKGRRFRVRDARLGREDGVVGDAAEAVDVDGDGWLDLVVGEGDWDDKNRGGQFRVLRNRPNSMPWKTRNWISVRVGCASSRLATSLHAVVSVSVSVSLGRGRGRGHTLMRRVGSSGTAVSVSLLETVHFGVGDAEVVDRVEVRWSDGSTETRHDVRTNSKTTFGVF